MTTLDERVLLLEAQLNALAQAWLLLTATVEVAGGIDISRMQASLRRRHWSQAPDLDDEARNTVAWLCDQLDEARRYRQVQRVGQEPLDESTRCASNVIAFPVQRQGRAKEPNSCA